MLNLIPKLIVKTAYNFGSSHAVSTFRVRTFIENLLDVNHNWSYWEKETFLLRADVIIVGGGIVGINAAISLKEQHPNKRIVVLERGLLPQGASTRNAGFACFGSMTELIDDLKINNFATVFSLVERRWHGLKRLRARVGDAHMDYKAYGAYELFRSDDIDALEQCRERLVEFNEALEDITGAPEVFAIRSDRIQEFGFAGVSELIVNRLEGQLHPGKMMRSLWQYARSIGVDIITGAAVEHLAPLAAGVSIKIADGPSFRADKVLLATNGFTRRLYPGIAVRPARNQVLISQPIKNLPFQASFHYEQGYYYFRNVGNRVLLGGGRHLDPEGEETDHFGHTELIQKKLLEMLTTVILPNTEVAIDQWWSGILGVGAQKTPIIQSVDENVFVAVRLGGMGVAIGSLVGEEAAQYLLQT